MKIRLEEYREIWFTSDWHFNHDREFIYKYRGFDSIEEHNDFILNSYFELVSNDDIIFNIGDFIFGEDWECSKLIRKLNEKGKMRFITGNHDKTLLRYLKNCPNMNLGQFKEVTILDNDDKYPITLCHYPMLSWNKSHYGAWSLCGHSHGSNPHSLPDDLNGKRLEVSIDVGLKFNKTFMFTFEDVKRIMDGKLITTHH